MARFCPECGKPTVRKNIGGRMRDWCIDGHFVQFANTPVSAGALVFKDHSVLLVQHNNPTKVWSLPGGYLEQEEDLCLSVIREVKEESNVDIKPLGIIAIRQLVKATTNECYIIFLAELASDCEPHSADAEEILNARFVDFNDLAELDITPFARRVVEGYLAQPPQPMPSFSINGYIPNAFMFGNV